ncbi:MAG: type II toxin-antitoxin system Phd/YefM family antitoxin [Thermoleophilia bacterium]
MKEVGIAEARRRLPELVEEAFFRGELWALTKSGRPRAVLIGFDEYEELAGKAATYEETIDPEAAKMDMEADADIEAGRVYEHNVVMAKLRESRRKRA